MTERRNRTVYEATVYHDEPEEAATDSREIGFFSSLSSATRAVNASRDAYWQTGGVRRGVLWESVLGVSPEYFESDDHETPWFVGTDGVADR